MSKNENLVKAKTVDNDEYYTRVEDVDEELVHYEGAFSGKTIYIPCDDPVYSAFWAYFAAHAPLLSFEKIIATYKVGDGEQATATIGTPVFDADGDYTGLDIKATPLEGSGDFLSDECLSILDESDLVVTNLPFSLFRKYIRAMMARNKDFIVIGGKNGGKYQDTIGYIMDGSMRLGVNSSHGSMSFITPDGKTAKVAAYWFTTLEHDQPPRALDLTCRYEGNEDAYPKYANYDAIEVSCIKDIPGDYFEKMGVPITFIEYFDPDKWILYGTNATVLENADQDHYIKARSHLYRRHNLYLEQDDGTFKRCYDRLIIQRKGK